MRLTACLFALVVLASCGVEGPPLPPQEPSPPASEVTIRGEAQMGVIGRL